MLVINAQHAKHVKEIIFLVLSIIRERMKSKDEEGVKNINDGHLSHSSL